MNEILDGRIGELLRVLKETGHWNDTMIVFTSDHGDGNAHHHWNQKQVLYDESARVPFIVAQPGSGMGRVDEKQLVNTGIDLIPTLCGLAGIECPEELKGHDWSSSLAESELPMQRDHIIIETEFGTFGKPAGVMGRAVRTNRFKYMVYSKGDSREFFADMENDPGEMKNLAGDPEYDEELERHRDLLRQYIVNTADIFPEGAIG